MWTYRKKVHLIYIELLKNRSGCQKTFFEYTFKPLHNKKTTISSSLDDELMKMQGMEVESKWECGR